MRGKSNSEHNFSGVGCNFRVFQGSFPGTNKIQGFSESSRIFWFCWPLCWNLKWLSFLIDVRRDCEIENKNDHAYRKSTRVDSHTVSILSVSTSREGYKGALESIIVGGLSTIQARAWLFSSAGNTHQGCCHKFSDWELTPLTGNIQLTGH